MLLWTVFALLLSAARPHKVHRAAKTFYVSSGHLAVLPCNPAGQGQNVTWSRGDQDLRSEEQQQSLGLEVHNRRLWFTPVHMSHSGVYTCHYRSKNRDSQAEIELSVSRERCPPVAEPRGLVLGETGTIPCKLQHICKASNFSSTWNVRWTKGCAPHYRPGQWVDERGTLWLPKVTPGDAGTYTCFVDLTVRGRNYSATWSVEVGVTNDTVFVEPHVVYPRNQEVQVHLGDSVALRCLADLGYMEDGHTLMYWLLNHSHTEEFPEVTHSWNFVSSEHRQVRAVSTLFISKVHRELLNISIVCCVQNAAGWDEGKLWLIQADPDPLHSALAWSLCLSLALLLLAVVLFCFRVELVLVHRRLRTRFTKHYVHDGKLYDGVVSYLPPPDVAPHELSHMQVLTQRLEGQWGYRLFVSGRDDCPGEAVHDALSETVRKSRRLLLLLFSSRTQGALSQEEEELQPLGYEQRVGLHDALTNKEPRVILVEIGERVNYSHLSKSVQYLKRTQGALEWRPASESRLRLLLRPEWRFWNRLRYHMPPVPSGRGGMSPSFGSGSCL